MEAFQALTPDSAVYRDGLLVVVRSDNPAGLRFVGEIDISNSTAIAESLLKCWTAQGNPHIDVSQLVFCDVSGIRALVTAAGNLGANRRLLLHGLAPELERVIQVTGWAEEPGITLCRCTGGSM